MNDISRRDAGKVIANCLITLTAGSIPVKAQDAGWITICSTGENLAKRFYHEGHMAVIARDVKSGTPIMRDEPGCEGDLKNLMGVVSDARRSGPDFQVKVKWISESPAGMSVIISAAAKMENNGSFELEEVRHLFLSGTRSNFMRATVT